MEVAMKVFTLFLCVFSMIMLVSCGDEPVLSPDSKINPDSGKTPDQDSTGIAPDTDNPGNEGPIPDNDTPAPQNCTTDQECGTGNICVSAKCTKGCASDTDCSPYTGTKCNTKLGRCLNVAASAQACGESKCMTGCCTADAGFLTLKCETTATSQKCGLCKQGEVFADGKTCVPAACKSGETKCQDYNATSSRKKCFECKAGELVCYDNTSNTQCTGSALMLFDAAKCVPAGEQCTADSTCCSGQPCIQGYCY